MYTFNTDPTKGVRAKEVPHIRARFGENELVREKEDSLLKKALEQFKSPLVAILLVAGVATFLLDEMIDFIVITIALIINVGVGVFQEERASRAFERLNASQEKYATVIRDGKKKYILSKEVVPGDVVVIESGAFVPADIRLIEAKNLQINESALTGEWAEVSKHVGIAPENTRITEQFNMAWMGTLVSSGYGRGIAVETGMHTQVGIIAESLDSGKRRSTPLQQNIHSVARFLVILITATIFGIFLLGLFRGENPIDMLLISIALAVAAMPQGLPAAVTVVLALGMESILKQGGLVRSLLAAETLGATTTVLTDKTGTLTEAKMKLVDTITISHQKGEEAVITRDRNFLLKSGVLASDAYIEHGLKDELVVQGRPIEKAVLLAGLEAGLPQDELTSVESRIDMLAFESSRRFGASLHREPAIGETARRMYISGAPETLLSSAGFVYENGKTFPITENHRRFFEQEQHRRAEKGMRLIGVGYFETTQESIPEDFTLPEDGFILAGFLAFDDPIRGDTKEAIAEVQQAGVRVVMVTGDNPITARNIAEQVGIIGAEKGVLTGADLATMNDEEALQALKTYSVIARVLPAQKLRIVHLLKNNNEIIAMTGDGINDAPALRSADIGIAVGSGTEVAKEASDIILLNNSFSIITSAIRTGRQIIDNLKKILAYLLSTNFSGISVISASFIAGTPLPILPTQILWTNIVEEGLMSFSFAFEPAEDDVMKRDPRASNARDILSRDLKKMIMIIAATTSVLLIALYFWLLTLDIEIEEVRTIIFVAFTLDSIFFAFSLKNLRKPIWRINFLDNKYLLVALSISVGLLLFALVFPPLKTLLSLESLLLWEIALLFGVGIANLSVIEILKFIFFARVRKNA